MVKTRVDLLIVGAAELVTLSGGSKHPVKGNHESKLGVIKDGGLAVDEGKIVGVGRSSEIQRLFYSEEKIDAKGKLVLPGFVDPHTHTIFAGAREKEFQMRIEGAGYLEIMKSGGGILKTVRATRKAAFHELVELGKERLATMLKHGSTTVEIKSGYGLNTETELKCLRAVKQLNIEQPVELVPTFLGGHAVPEEYKGNSEEYVDIVVEEMIPEVAKHQLAVFCDVFFEKDVFNINQSRRILLQGVKHGLTPKIHADELSQIGGAELAAEVGAITAEHLIFASENGLKAMAKRRVIAVLLPAASLALMKNEHANAKKLIHENVALALGTDFNPSCWMENQQLVISLACRLMRMTPAEALVAATINSAHALNRGSEVGSLEVGKKADIIVLNIPNHIFLGYRFGVNLVEKVVKSGKLVINKNGAHI